MKHERDKSSIYNGKLFDFHGLYVRHQLWCDQTHTHPFNRPFPRTTQVSRYQKGKTIWILLKQETVSGTGISWDICKSAPRSRQITTPAPHHSVFYRPDALPATQPTASKHWRHYVKAQRQSTQFFYRQDTLPATQPTASKQSTKGTWCDQIKHKISGEQTLLSTASNDEATEQAGWWIHIYTWGCWSDC